MEIQEDNYTVRLKSLKRLENLLNNSILIPETFLGSRRVVRTKDGTYATRTHNIDIKGKVIWYEGSQSKWFFFEFETIDEAESWWATHIEPLIKR